MLMASLTALAGTSMCQLVFSVCSFYVGYSFFRLVLFRMNLAVYRRSHLFYLHIYLFCIANDMMGVFIYSLTVNEISLSILY